MTPALPEPIAICRNEACARRHYAVVPCCPYCGAPQQAELDRRASAAASAAAEAEAGRRAAEAAQQARRRADEAAARKAEREAAEAAELEARRQAAADAAAETRRKTAAAAAAAAAALAQRRAEQERQRKAALRRKAIKRLLWLGVPAALIFGVWRAQFDGPEAVIREVALTTAWRAVELPPAGRAALAADAPIRLRVREETFHVVPGEPMHVGELAPGERMEARAVRGRAQLKVLGDG